MCILFQDAPFSNPFNVFLARGATPLKSICHTKLCLSPMSIQDGLGASDTGLHGVTNGSFHKGIYDI